MSFFRNVIRTKFWVINEQFFWEEKNGQTPSEKRIAGFSKHGRGHGGGGGCVKTL